MSCTYQRATTSVAAMTGLSRPLISTAMDIARQRRVAVPTPSAHTLPAIAAALGLSETCGNPVTVIQRVWVALLVLIRDHASDSRRRRWLAVAEMLGVPTPILPEPAHPAVIETVRRQWTTDLTGSDNLTTTGLRALRDGGSIPTEPIEEALRMGDRQAIVTWIAHGVWDDRFEDICADLTDTEIGIMVRAGVLPDSLASQVVTWWPSDHLPWEAFPIDLWDRVPHPDIARKGRAQTAATQVIRYPNLRTDDRLIAAIAQDGAWTVEVLLHNIDDDRLILTAARYPLAAAKVLSRTTIRDERLIDAAIRDPAAAAEVLCRTTIRDERLIAAAAKEAETALQVLTRCHDLCDERLIAVVANNPYHAKNVVACRQDLRHHPLMVMATSRYTMESLM